MDGIGGAQRQPENQPIDPVRFEFRATPRSGKLSTWLLSPEHEMDETYSCVCLKMGYILHMVILSQTTLPCGGYTCGPSPERGYTGGYTPLWP